MTNRKKQLTELAQRVMDGNDLEISNVLHEAMRYGWIKHSPKAWHMNTCGAALSAIKALEEELLPDYQDTWFTTVNIGDQDDGEPFKVSVGLFEVRKPYKYGGISVSSTTPTEEAARLAALLLALAEMEEE